MVRIKNLGLTRIATDSYLTHLHQTRLNFFFGLNRMNSDWFGMNFNPTLLPGQSQNNGPRAQKNSLWVQSVSLERKMLYTRSP